jgi:hypothetical protein
LTHIQPALSLKIRQSNPLSPHNVTNPTHKTARLGSYVTSEKIPPGDRTTNTDCESQGMAMPTLVGVVAETSAVEFFIVGNHSPDFCSVQENVRNS